MTCSKGACTSGKLIDIVANQRCDQAELQPAEWLTRTYRRPVFLRPAMFVCLMADLK